MSAIAKLVRVTRSRQEWAESITSTWQRAVTQAVQVVILTGQDIIEAKKALKHGDFIEMIEHDLPFNRHTANKLMKIAADTRLTNGSHGNHLPPTWTTLYALTPLSDEELERGFDSGAIHPAMERKDVAALRGKPRKRRQKAMDLAVSKIAGPIDICAAAVRRQIFEALQDMGNDDRIALIERLRGEIDDLEEKNVEMPSYD